MGPCHPNPQRGKILSAMVLGTWRPTLRVGARAVDAASLLVGPPPSAAVPARLRLPVVPCLNARKREAPTRLGVGRAARPPFGSPFYDRCGAVSGYLTLEYRPASQGPISAAKDKDLVAVLEDGRLSATAPPDDSVHAHERLGVSRSRLVPAASFPSRPAPLVYALAHGDRVRGRRCDPER